MARHHGPALRDDTGGSPGRTRTVDRGGEQVARCKGGRADDQLEEHNGGERETEKLADLEALADGLRLESEIRPHDRLGI
jgi:hypothetical protein